MLVVSLSSCKTESNNQVSDCVDWCWEYYKQHPKGFTLNIRTCEEVKEGIVVSYKATQNNFGKEGLKASIIHALSHCGIIGGWFDQESNLYYFDSDTLFEETMLEQALEWARKNNQKSVFVLSTQETVTCQ